MRQEERRDHSPYWRTLLEERWQARLQEVTELSLAYHGAAAAGQPGQQGQQETREERWLLRRAVAARRRLADVEEALGRLASGDFGRCEECGSPIPAGLLLAIPESRYCAGCAAGPAAAVPPRTPVPGTPTQRTAAQRTAAQRTAAQRTSA